MAITFYAEDVDKPRLKYTPIKNWIREILYSFNKKVGNINYIYCSDEFLLEINKKYLQHDYFTDIVTFDFSEGNDTISGDMYISIDRVAENALMYGTDESEMYRVIIHGIFHLIGFKDNTTEEIEEMRKLEEDALKKLNKYLLY